MNIAIIGGTFDTVLGKSSSVVNKIYDIFEYRDLRNMSIDNVDCVNGGGNIEFFSSLNKAADADLVIWMPNISNETEKQYPVKKKGAILICSKVMREGYKRIDAVSRIFKMHGNAVIAIYKDSEKFRFELIDALANIWYTGSNISELCGAIEEFVNFTLKAKRINTKQRESECDLSIYNEQLQGLIDCNKKLQEHITQSCGARFFGNISTRCSKLFPSMRAGETCMFVSPRNVDKTSITPDMMVPYFNDDTYIGNRKPSVDSPTQVRLYQSFPNINFMIHGHAIIDNMPMTSEYCLCGDINEADEVKKIVDENESSFIVNLKNHGFLIGADSIEKLNNVIDDLIVNANIKITNQD